MVPKFDFKCPPMIKAFLTKLIKENQNDWDEQLSIVLFLYCTTFKVATIYTFYQLV
jgi:hypothetical protein